MEEDRWFVCVWMVKKENDKVIMVEVRGWDADARSTTSRWMSSGVLM